MGTALRFIENTPFRLPQAAAAAVLRANAGNRTRTARELGIGPATLYRKIKEYRLPAARD